MSDITDEVGEDNETELSRLGSSKALYALTRGEMEDDVVLGRAGDVFHYAAVTLEEWAAEGTPVAEDAAATVREAYETTVAERGDHDPGEEPAVSAALAAFDDDAARLGALVGWTMAVGETVAQLTGYFVGQADPQTASTFRGVGDDVEAVRERALDALSDDEREQARAAAETVVQDAYDEYFETLEELGVNPKPVC